MLKLLGERVSRRGAKARDRLRLFHTDALAFKPDTPPYDLVVTHFFLDCLTEGELAILLANIKPNLAPIFAPRSTWLVSEFAIPQGQAAARLSRLVIATLYRAFRILAGLKTQRLPDYASVLCQYGFSITEQKSFLGGILVTQLWNMDANPEGNRTAP
jgi:hypothetical protein